jgi:hypothetical protein
MKYLIVLLALVMFTGCSSKEIRYNTLGEKSIITKSSEDVYHDAQSKAWSGYYEALKNPPIIASIQNTDGTIITINSQLPPPAPIIRQHENQYIKPVTEVMKWAIGGVVIDRGISAVVRGMGDTVVSNSGDGNVVVDRSDSIAGKSSTTIDTKKSTDNSDGSMIDNTDNSLINPDPTVVVVDPPETVIVEQPSPIIVEQPPPLIVDPVVVDPVVIEPSYPPVP